MGILVTLSDILSLFMFMVILVVCFWLFFMNAINQWACKHDGGVWETPACDARCKKCGKNLGFIGTWREKHKDNE